MSRATTQAFHLREVLSFNFDTSQGHRMERIGHSGVHNGLQRQSWHSHGSGFERDFSGEVRMDHDYQANPQDRASVFGIAALTLVEAILLTLQANGMLTTDEVDEAFDAAISAHRNQPEAHSAQENEMAAVILSKLRVEGNSVRLDL
ncbi:MAG: hypothetical protein LJE62_13850 [Silicimonas sp.]|nr:hypothetical protein [Silicimonas sp.]